MLCLKKVFSFICVIGSLLGYGGFYSSLAMEAAVGDENPIRRKSPSPEVRPVDADGEIHSSPVIPSAVSGDAGSPPIILVKNETRLMNAILHQRRKYRVEEDFFFVSVPVRDDETERATALASIEGSSAREEGIDDRRAIPPRAYKITSVKRTDGVLMVSGDERSVQELGVTLLESLIQRSRYLPWPSVLSAHDYVHGSSFAQSSSIESTHLFHISEEYKKSTLEEYLREGVCWVGGHTTTLKGKLHQDGIEILFSAETEFSPIPADITGIYYMRDPHDHKIFVVFLIKSSLFPDSESQFVFSSETMLESNALVGLPNWVHWDLAKSPSYQGVQYPERASTYGYVEGWWRDWVTGVPDYVSLNYPLRAFLGQFQESLLLHGKEKGPDSQGVVIGFKPPETGFYEILSAAPLRRKNYVHMGPDKKLSSTQLFSQAWRREKETTFLSVIACQIDPVELDPSNLILPAGLRQGFYEVISETNAGEDVQWRYMMDESVVTLQRKDPAQPYNDFVVQKKGEENGLLADVLQAAQQPSLFNLIVEDNDILGTTSMRVLVGAMDQWQHLTQLTLRNCFNENSLNVRTARPFFNALRGLNNLQALDFSNNGLDMDTFRVLAYTLLGKRSKNLTDISLSLPKKPSAVTTAVKRNQISFWTINQVEPLIYMPFLRTLEVFGVRRGQEGCAVTKNHLETRRMAIGTNSKGEATFFPLTMTLHPSSEVPEDQWEILDASTS